jgi:NADH dehydrogenase (ubiquinone) 1 alpha subcomplex subunit 9
MEWRHLKPLADYGMLVPHYFHAKDQASVDACVPKGTDVVLNLIGKRYETKHYLPWLINNTFEDTHVRATRAVALAARRAGAKHMVQVSSARAAKDSPSDWARTKFQGELMAKQEFPGVAIVRPGAMYGEEDNLLNWYAARQYGPLPLVNGGTASLKPVFVGDVAAALATIVGDWERFCDTEIDLLGNDTYTQKQIAEYVYDTIGRPKSLVDVASTSAMVQLGARVLESLPNPVVTRDELALATCSDAATSGALTFEDLGIAPQPFESKAFNYLFRFRPGGHFVELRKVEAKKGPAHVSHLLQKRVEG